MTSEEARTTMCAAVELASCASESARRQMKQKTVFACQECGAQSPKWLGRCADCGAWNSLVEERPLPPAATAGAAAGGAPRYSLAAAAGPQLYADIDTVVAERLSTGIGEFDRVLGGGVVPGSLVLIGGEPGIGKSTLLLQAAAHFREVGRARSSTAPARNPSTRSSRAASGSAWSRRRSTSWPRPVSSASSRRSRGCGRPSSSSTRSRRCSR